VILYFQKYDNGEIMSWGEEPLPGAIGIEAPEDFRTHGPFKYVISGGALVARPGWTSPTPDDPELVAEANARRAAVRAALGIPER
jgi:hypothetical protein